MLPRVRFNATERNFKEPIMFDRIFFPTLVFIALAAVTSAFAIDAVRSAAPQGRQTVVQLEPVVIVVKRDSQPVALAQAEGTVSAR